MDTNWLVFLQDPDYVWHSRYPAATKEEVEQLASYCGHRLPADYADFLRTCSGGELSYRELWMLHLWPMRDIPAWSTAYGFDPQRMPNALAFGDNGGGEAFVFDLRSDHPDGCFPVVAVNLVSISWDEVIPVAKCFRDLLLQRHPLL